MLIYCSDTNGALRKRIFLLSVGIAIFVVMSLVRTLFQFPYGMFGFDAFYDASLIVLANYTPLWNKVFDWLCICVPCVWTTKFNPLAYRSAAELEAEEAARRDAEAEQDDA